MTLFRSRRPDADVAAELTGSRGPLAGVRLAVEDTVDVAGLPTTAGFPEFAYVPERDAPAVAALRAAGAVVVGRTDLDPSPSSADAIATGQADIAIGIDAAASGLHGIVGIRPTGRVISTRGVVAARESGTGVTILATDVELANHALSVIAGAACDRGWPADVRMAASPNPVVAVPDELPELDQQCRTAFDATVARLADAGATVVTVDLEPFLAAAKLQHDSALIIEKYVAVSELIDVHPNASLDPGVR